MHVAKAALFESFDRQRKQASTRAAGGYRDCLWRLPSSRLNFVFYSPINLHYTFK